MRILKTISAALAAALISSAASAAIVDFTEGNRPDIVGSVRADADGDGTLDTSGTPPGFDMGTLTAGDTFGLYGKIGNIQDFYNFDATSRFSVTWDFDGYTDTTGFKAVSGFIGATQGSATFTLINTATMVSVTSALHVSDIVAGAEPNIFGAGVSFAAGSYELVITGYGANRALYDVNISAVPLPAGALLMLTGLAGFGIARRRKS